MASKFDDYNLGARFLSGIGIILPYLIGVFFYLKTGSLSWFFIFGLAAFAYEFLPDN